MVFISSAIRFCVLVSLSVLAVAAEEGATALPSSEECSQLGYNNGIVQCSDCQVLGDAAGDEGLKKECLRCCVVKTEEKYQLAVLELDSRYASRAKNLADMVEAADKLDVVVRNKLGSRPVLLMYKERTDELPEVELNVFSWTIDIFKEYIQDHVSKA